MLAVEYLEYAGVHFVHPADMAEVDNFWHIQLRGIPLQLHFPGT